MKPRAISTLTIITFLEIGLFSLSPAQATKCCLGSSDPRIGTPTQCSTLLSDGKCAGTTIDCSTNTLCPQFKCCVQKIPDKAITCIEYQVGVVPSPEANCPIPPYTLYNYSCENAVECAKSTIPLPNLPTTSPEPTFEPVIPKLQINIPGVQFSNIKVKPGETVSIPWIMEYIKGVYKYLLGVAIFLAIIMVTIAGFRWLTAGGNASIIGDAKKQITNAIIGLLLAFGVVVVLQTINPELIKLKPISIKTIATQIVTIQDSGDTEDDVSSEAYSKPNINCPKSGGAAAIPGIVTGLMGKVTYRMGGKGGLPPYRETNQKYLQYNNSCPSGTLCFDCSGFVNFVLRCAGLSAPGGGTGKIFSASSEQITSIDAAHQTVNGKALQIGDLLGYAGVDSSNGIGHVYIYVGEGKLASSNGGDINRKDPGGLNPRFMSLPSDTKILKRILRVSP